MAFDFSRDESAARKLLGERMTIKRVGCSNNVAATSQEIRMHPADDDLWLMLHRLSNALAEAGPDRDKRLRAALSGFEALPAPVRLELHKELRNVSIDLLALLPLVSTFQEATGSSNEWPGEVL